MIREKIKKDLADCLKADLAASDGHELEFAVSTPPASVSCDLSVNVALVLAKRLGRPPQILAKELSERIPQGEWCERVEVAAPGFLNFWIRDSALAGEVQEILTGRPGYGPAPAGSRSSVLIEFVSANPTGPLHVGHGRGAALGDSLARILRFLGHRVTTEYYLNDVGNQIDMLGRSILARRNELAGEPVSFPENGYRGAYVIDVARKAAQRQIPEDRLAEFAVEEILSGIQKDLEGFRVHFDSWFRESALYETGLVDACFKALEEKGYLYESEGALWFAASRFLDEKDRVIKRRDERPTYFASDIAYHFRKVQAGHEHLINIWGADHHGYAPRLRSVLAAFGAPEGRLEILLYQLVSLVKGGKPISMSTRSGEFETLRELIDEVGTDACRFFYALRAPGTHLEFDLELAKKQAPENPVYYVQYVHARICSIFREAQKAGSQGAGGSLGERAFPQTALEKEERALILELSRFPEIVRICARDRSPHHLTSYLLDVARTFHAFYEKHRVLTPDPAVTQWRLSILEAVRTLVRQGLDCLGVSAPEKL